MRRIFIKSCSTILSDGLHTSAEKLDTSKVDTTLLKCSLKYPELISPRATRRLSKAVKMGVISGLAAIGDSKVDSIITCTGLGCLDDTEKFLKPIIEDESVIMSPTSFIQSTHNTVGGQLAILKGIKGYNMTYTQRGMSFFSGLVDAQLLDSENILCGTFDEQIDISLELLPQLKCSRSELPLGEGSSFFLFTKEGEVSIENIEVLSNDTELINTENLVLTNSKTIEAQYSKVINYGQLCGDYFTSDAFAVFLADNLLRFDDNFKRINILHKLLNSDNVLHYILEREI